MMESENYEYPLYGMFPDAAINGRLDIVKYIFGNSEFRADLMDELVFMNLDVFNSRFIESVGPKTVEDCRKAETYNFIREKYPVMKMGQMAKLNESRMGGFIFYDEPTLWQKIKNFLMRPIRFYQKIQDIVSKNEEPVRINDDEICIGNNPNFIYLGLNDY